MVYVMRNGRRVNYYGYFSGSKVTQSEQTTDYQNYT